MGEENLYEELNFYHMGLTILMVIFLLLVHNFQDMQLSMLPYIEATYVKIFACCEVSIEIREILHLEGGKTVILSETLISR